MISGRRRHVLAAQVGTQVTVAAANTGKLRQTPVASINTRKQASRGIWTGAI